MSSRVLCTSDCQSEKDSLRAEIARRDQELNRLRIQQSEDSALTKVKALAEQYRCTTSAGEDDHLRAELACEIIEILGGRTEQASVQQSEDSESLRRENQALSEQLDAVLRDYRELQSRMKQALQSKGADTKQIGDELHDILAASLLECNCDESSKCTACRIDDLAHRLSPFAEGGTVQALQSEGPTPHELRQRIAEISRGGDIEFGPPTDYDYALADAVLKALGHTQQSEDVPTDDEPAASWAFASSLTAASEMYHNDKHGPMCTCELSKLLREFAGGMMTERCKAADERRTEQALCASCGGNDQVTPLCASCAGGCTPQ